MKEDQGHKGKKKKNVSKEMFKIKFVLKKKSSQLPVEDGNSCIKSTQIKYKVVSWLDGCWINPVTYSLK